MKRFYFFCFIVIFIFAALGELIRIPLGPGNGFLPNDLWIGILLLIWMTDKTFLQRQWPKNVLWIPFLSLVSTGIISLIHGSQWLTAKESIVSGFYFIRWIEYTALIFIAIDLGEDKKGREKLKHLLYGGTLVVTLLGFLQLNYFPSFLELKMQDRGWDPHIGRLLSTWFDPNFIGGLLGFILCLMLSEWSHRWKSLGLLGGILINTLGLFLTYSRSAYLAFVGGAGFIGIFKSRKLLIIGLIGGLLLISISDRAQERVTNLYYSAISILSEESTELPDYTARLRLESWGKALEIIKDHPWLGVGYNAYGLTQRRYGFIDHLEEHHATGSDSSLLTIWATLGIFGLIAYVGFISTLLWKSLSNPKHPFKIGFFAGTLSLLIHSIFVNSLLFNPLLIFFSTAAGIMYNIKSTDS